MYNNVVLSPGVPNPANVRIIDMSCLPMIAAMHQRGIRIDAPYMRDLDAKILLNQSNITRQIPDAIGNAYQDTYNGKRSPFNVGSPDHIARLLFQELKIAEPGEIKLTKSKKREAVDDDVLSLLAKRHPVVPLISEWRKLDKLHSTYTGPDCILARLVDGAVHTRFTVTVAATGRLSSRNPNLQNIPARSDLGKLIRMAFVARPGHALVSCDLSQIEMRWAAHRSQDPIMMAVFRKREDIHTRTACNVFELDYTYVMSISNAVEAGTATAEQKQWWKEFKQQKRLPCKTVGFGVLYGQTPEGLQKSLATEGVYWTIQQCTDLIQRDFFGVYPKLRNMLESDYRYVQRYAISCDDFGRARLVPEAKSVHSWIREAGIRKAGNHPEQSSAQCGLKIGMAEVQDVLVLDYDGAVHPLLQIHDELIFEVEVPYADQFASECSGMIQNAVPLTVPVDSSSDIAERWGELK